MKREDGVVCVCVCFVSIHTKKKYCAIHNIDVMKLAQTRVDEREKRALLRSLIHIYCRRHVRK